MLEGLRLGGGRLAGQRDPILVFQKGIPVALGNGGNSANLGAPGIRPTTNGQNLAKDGSIGGRLGSYFDQTVFTQTANYAFGNVGRFLPNVRQPGAHNLDMSLFKNFRPIEGLKMQFRAEAYNATNSPTWGGLGTAVNNPSKFGIITSKSGNRTMQLGLKMIF